MTAARPADPMSTTEPSGGSIVRHAAAQIADAVPRPPCARATATSTTLATVQSERSAQARCSVRPAPRREPAFDDEPTERHLHLVRRSTTPELPFPVTPRTTEAKPHRLTLVPTSTSTPTPTPAPAPPTQTATHAPTQAPTVDRRPVLAETPAPAAPGRSGDQRSPDPTRFGRQFAQGAIEAMSGRRPMVQLTRHVSPAVQRGLARAGGTHPLASGVTPLLHSLHLSQPADGVCEMSAIVVVGPRYRALAARLEWKIDHWRCTALQLG